MKIQTLVATIDQSDFSLVDKMNLQTDAVIGNQCGENSERIVPNCNRNIVYYNTAVRGVGRNRNLLIDKATADICVFADDDMRFVDGYPDVVLQAFEQCPDADILVFNLIEKNPRRFINTKIFRVNNKNYAKYGAARIAFRRESIVNSGIRFNLRFGGGTEFGSGEDTIFLHDCLKKNLKIYAVPYAIAEIDQDSESTWFDGYTEKFFNDKGALYSHLHPNLWPIFSIRFLVKYRNKFGKDTQLLNSFAHMIKGARNYRSK